MIYDQPYNATFINNIESVQYKAALAITGAIKGTSRERLYQELGLESLCDRRRYRRLIYFFNIVKHHSPNYLSSLLPDKQRSLNPQRSELYKEIFSHSLYFDSSFYPFCVKAWNQLESCLRNSLTVSIFKKALLKCYRPTARSIFNIHDPIGLKLLTVYFQRYPKFLKGLFLTKLVYFLKLDFLNFYVDLGKVSQHNIH